MKAKILWIEGKRAGSPSFVPSLRKKGFEVEMVSSGIAALAHISAVGADLVAINAASLRSSGKRICQNIRQQTDGLPILMISNPDHPVEKEEVCAETVLRLPFTSRKLINQIKPLLPTDEENILEVGLIRLDQTSRRVYCEDREARLTPRLASLLTTFMQQPGVVIEREQLFRKVWKTEYIEDTRTLDVHISWLRRAIEENPRRPRFLKTIRGVGYRLDV